MNKKTKEDIKQYLQECKQIQQDSGFEMSEIISARKNIEDKNIIKMISDILVPKKEEQIDKGYTNEENCGYTKKQRVIVELYRNGTKIEYSKIGEDNWKPMGIDWPLWNWPFDVYKYRVVKKEDKEIKVDIDTIL